MATVVSEKVRLYCNWCGMVDIIDPQKVRAVKENHIAKYGCTKFYVKDRKNTHVITFSP